MARGSSATFQKFRPCRTRVEQEQFTPTPAPVPNWPYCPSAVCGRVWPFLDIAAKGRFPATKKDSQVPRRGIQMGATWTLTEKKKNSRRSTRGRKQHLKHLAPKKNTPPSNFEPGNSPLSQFSRGSRLVAAVLAPRCFFEWKKIQPAKVV